jgi:hypothetical protein
MMQTNVRRGFNANQFQLGNMQGSQHGQHMVQGNYGYNNLDVHEYYRLNTSPPNMIQEVEMAYPGVGLLVQRDADDAFLDPFDLYTRVILDSGATDSTFCNANLLHNIYPANNPLHMCTNTGSRLIHEMGQCGNFLFDVYYDPNGVANVLSLNQLINEGYTVKMDSDTCNEFLVYCGNGDTMRFSNRGGIYVLDRVDEDGPDPTTQDHFTSAYWRERLNPGYDSNSNQPHFGRYSRDAFIGLNKSEKMATVRSNKEGFTPAQVKAAEAARSAMHIVGAPDIKNIKYAIRGGLFKNCPITEEAINHAEEIYGPDGSTLKGKSTRPTTRK